MHGMHLSYLMGIGNLNLVSSVIQRPALNPKNIYFLGVRALDDGEKKIAQDLSLSIFSPSEIREKTIEVVIQEIMKDIENKGIEYIHISFDVDSIDPFFAPGTGVPEKNGFLVEEVLLILNLIYNSGNVKSMDIVEWNSVLDDYNKSTEQIILKVVNTIR